eukprot:8383718-Pyramimonas_sp.AAC.1
MGKSASTTSEAPTYSEAWLCAPSPVGGLAARPWRHSRCAGARGHCCGLGCYDSRSRRELLDRRDIVDRKERATRITVTGPLRWEWKEVKPAQPSAPRRLQA